MKPVFYVRFYPDEWRHLTFRMTLLQTGLFDKIYSYQLEQRRPVPLDRAEAADRLNVQRVQYGKVLDELIAAVYVTETADGITCAIAERHMQAAANAIDDAGKTTGRASRSPAQRQERAHHAHAVIIEASPDLPQTLVGGTPDLPPTYPRLEGKKSLQNQEGQKGLREGEGEEEGENRPPGLREGAGVTAGEATRPTVGTVDPVARQGAADEGIEATGTSSYHRASEAEREAMRTRLRNISMAGGLKAGKAVKSMRARQRTKGELDGSEGIDFTNGKLTVVNGSAAGLLADFPGIDLAAVCDRAGPDLTKLRYPTADDAMAVLRKWARIATEDAGRATHRKADSRSKPTLRELIMRENANGAN